MNKLGIEKFLKEVRVGDELSVNTREHSYFGKVTQIEAECFIIDEGGLKSYVYYAHIWAYAKH